MCLFLSVAYPTGQGAQAEGNLTRILGTENAIAYKGQLLYEGVCRLENAVRVGSRLALGHRKRPQ